MKKTLPLAFSLFLGAASCLTAAGSSPKLVKLWESDAVFKTPESVLYSADHDVLYVSNMGVRGREAKERLGGLGKLGLDGKVVSAEWVKGLQAPKGMAVWKDKLYVTDVEVVVEVDTKKGEINRTIEIPGAQSLNDLSVDKDGVLYVTDAKDKKVYRIADGKPELVVQDLKGPNGVLAHEGKLYVADAGGLYEIQKDKTLRKIADGMEGGTDGIEVHGDGFIVSCWAGVIYYVGNDGTKTTLLDTREEKSNTADIGYDAKKKILYVPTFHMSKVVAYKVE